MFKTCSKCSQELPIGRFSRNANYKDGYQSACKTCCNAARMIRYHGLREGTFVPLKYREVIIEESETNRLLRTWRPASG